MQKKKKIAILGSTGSIGTQALEVIANHKDRYELFAITGNNNIDLLIKQARTFNPEVVITTQESHYGILKQELSNLDIKVFAGMDAVCQTVQMECVDVVLTAMVGYAGLKPTIAAIKASKVIALANKETLVVAGEIIQELAMKHKSPIIPVDSEHSAIFQCLTGEGANPIDRVILTASGGPFRTFDRKKLENVTAKDALKHPNWVMGAKITIDSATMMNKGFEVIEAKWLFGLHPHQIDVVVHPQSIIHSMVEFSDSSIKAQLGLPDMKLPIIYAFSYPDRVNTNFERLDFEKYSQLTFEKPDVEKFKNLQLAYYAMNRGGNMPCMLNAANEVVVEAFLKEKVGFLQMSDIIENIITKETFIQNPSYDDYVETDRIIRNITAEMIP